MQHTTSATTSRRPCPPRRGGDMKRLAERDLACPEGRVLLHGRQPRPIVRLPSVRLRPPWQPHRQSREDQTASLTLHPNPPRASHTKPATTARRSGCSRCPAPDRPAGTARAFSAAARCDDVRRLQKLCSGPLCSHLCPSTCPKSHRAPAVIGLPHRAHGNASPPSSRR
jgi:hypothetical protein